jgi:hypothetical protein
MMIAIPLLIDCVPKSLVVNEMFEEYQYIITSSPPAQEDLPTF